MTEITAGHARYIVEAEIRAGRWVASALRAESRDKFGIECTAETAHEAIERLTRWLMWQAEHAAALDALRQAEQSYHRTVAGSGFVDTGEGPSAIELQQESLDQVEAARTRLDEIRGRRPN